MDFCEGGSTENLIRRNDGKLSLNLATWIILQALDGLDYVHNAAVTAALCGREPSSDGAETIVTTGVSGETLETTDALGGTSTKSYTEDGLLR